ncbi:MAG: ParA family protein [Candidatus Glassbacteria bacterium]
MRKIAIVNQKGGTGKTTTAGNLSAGLAMKGRRVLMIDLDIQGNLGIWFNISSGRSLCDVILDNMPVEACIRKVRENLYLLPGGAGLAELEMLFVKTPMPKSLIHSKFEDVQDYDYIILDCAPSWNLLNQDAMLFAEEMFIPTSMEYLAMIGIRQIVKNIVTFRRNLGHTLQIALIIPTFYNARQRKDREVMESLRMHFKEKVSDPIRTNVKLSEAVSYHKSIFEYDNNCNGAADYQVLVERVDNG